MFDDMLSQSDIDALLGFSYDDDDDDFSINKEDLELYDFDSLFKVAQQIRVPYPEHLANELKTCFKNNKNFIDALDEGKANAISHLDDLASYSKNKRQLDAYSNLYSWLIENNIEFIDHKEDPQAGESSDNEIVEGDHEKVEGSDDEQKQNNKSTEHSNKKMDESQKDENGNVEDGSNSKSSEKTDKIQENKDGQVSKEEQGQQSNNSSKQSPSNSSSQGQSSSTNPQTQAQKQAGGSGKQNKEEKKSLKDRLKSALGMNKQKSPTENKTTLPQKEQSINETKKDIKQPNPINKEMLNILSEIQKELDMQENDSDDEKIESDQDNERHDLVRPGGRQISKTKAEEIVKEWVERMAISGVHLKTTGYEKWDKKKIAKYVVTEQEWRIPTAKYKHLPDKIMFMLDFSGSCSWISKTFAQLGHAATHYNHIIVAYGGYEGYVQGFITKDTDINNIENNLHRHGFYGLGYGESADKYEDISLGSYLQQNRDIKTCIILGDYDGTQRYVDAYLRNRHVKFTWFLCERYSNYRGHMDLYGLKNHIYYFDGSVEGLAKLVKTYK